MINENVHVPLEDNVDKLADAVINALEYKLYSMAVKSDIFFADVKRLPANFDILSCGKNWDEFAKAMEDELKLEREKRMFNYPIVTEFRITDKENPCSSFISSDCVYRFTIDSVFSSYGNRVELKDAYIENDGLNFIAHDVVFEFNISLDELGKVKSMITHEAMHVYDEVRQYAAKAKDEDNYFHDDDLWKQFGYFKKDRDKERDETYRFVANLVSATNNDTSRSLDSVIVSKSVNLIAKAIYMLFPAEIKANYAEFYKEASDHKGLKCFDNRAYRKYYDLYIEIMNGFYVTDYKTGKQIHVDSFPDNEFMDKKVIPIAMEIFKTKRDFSTVDELKTYILKRINLVIERMKKIDKFVKNEQKSTENEFKESFNSHYDGILESLKENYGEVEGMYRFTMRRYYGSEEFYKVINEIRRYFRKIETGLQQHRLG